MFRSEIKVLDCSIRDGGLINKWQFSDKFIRKTYEAVSSAGIDYMNSILRNSGNGVSAGRMMLKKFLTDWN